MATARVGLPKAQHCLIDIQGGEREEKLEKVAPTVLLFPPWGHTFVTKFVLLTCVQTWKPHPFREINWPRSGLVYKKPLKGIMFHSCSVSG